MNEGGFTNSSWYIATCRDYHYFGHYHSPPFFSARMQQRTIKASLPDTRRSIRKRKHQNRRLGKRKLREESQSLKFPPGFHDVRKEESPLFFFFFFSSSIVCCHKPESRVFVPGTNKKYLPKWKRFHPQRPIKLGQIRFKLQPIPEEEEEEQRKSTFFCCGLFTIYAKTCRVVFRFLREIAAETGSSNIYCTVVLSL